jgi:arylsulfatase A-like enzyme
MASLTTGRPGPAKRALKKLYGQRVELVDGFIGDILDGIERMGLEKNTAVVVTSDHGEQLGDHGRWAHGPDLHDELIRVPLILHGPGMGAGRRIEDQVELLGLAPTLLDLLGLPAPPSFLGASFAPTAGGGSGVSAGPIFSEAMHSGGRRSRSGVPDTFTITSCREDGWKYIHDTEDGGEELFDLGADPTEVSNVVLLHPVRASDLRRLVERHRESCSTLAATFEDGGEPAPTPDDAEMRRRLAALGYL